MEDYGQQTEVCCPFCYAKAFAYFRGAAERMKFYAAEAAFCFSV